MTFHMKYLNDQYKSKQILILTECIAKARTEYTDSGHKDAKHFGSKQVFMCNRKMYSKIIEKT